MKINKIIYIITLIIAFTMMINTNECYAFGVHGNQVMVNDGGGGSGAPGSEGATGQAPSTGGNSTTVQGDADQNLPTLDDSFKPTVTLGSSETIITTILGVLTVVGIIAVVVGIAMIGFGSILGSAGEKAEAQTKLVGIVIAGALIIGGSTIARLIITAAEKIG